MNKFLLFLLALVSIVQFSFAIYGFPIFVGDAECFLPTAFSLRFHEGLMSPFYSEYVSYEGKFIFYPPIYPVFISFFLFETSPQFLYLVLAFINVLSICLLVFSIGASINKKDCLGGDRLNKVFLASIVIAIAGYHTPGYTRPEVLVRLFLSSLLLLYALKVKYFHFFAGLIVTLTILTSPVSGFNTFWVALLMLLREANMKKSFLFFFCGCLSIVALFYVLYPFELNLFITSLMKQSKRGFFMRNDPKGFGEFLKYHVLSVNFCFGILIALLALYVAIQHVVLESGAQKKAKIICLVILFSSVLFFVLRVVQSSYNLYGVSPVYFYCIAEFYFTSRNKFFKYIAVGVMSLASLSFLRYSLVFIATITNSESMTLQQTQVEIDKYRNMDKKYTIGVSTGMWPFFVKDSINHKIKVAGADTINGVDYIILQQYTLQQKTPLKKDGYKIIENHYFEHDLKLFGVTLAKYPPLHQFCIYKKMKIVR